ncbi:hypothetical protein GCM10023191_020920 [Actinoallomurus oryzae]|uniref:Aldehyde dehydrogenase domain-containing protein n=1 Tax=Actinoallomurus oryzae TaxID=502180 RepID=A0ABP8PNY0_9ACTN
MPQTLLKAGDDLAQAAAPVAGEWGGEGPQTERAGPHLRRPVGRAPVARPADAAVRAAEEVGVISFAGSAETGDAVARAAGAGRLVLELGGDAATIVCEDTSLWGERV